MERNRVSLPYIAVFLIVCVVSFFVSWIWYGTRDKLPAGLTVGDWAVEGISVAEFERQLAYKKELILQQPVRLVSQQPEAPMQPVQWTMEQLGLELPLQQVLEQLEPLRSGSPFRRAVYRWKLRHQKWPLPARLDAAKLHAALVRGLPSWYEKQPVDARRIIGPQDTVSYVPEASVMRIDESDLQQRLQTAVPSLEAAAWAAAGMHPVRGNAVTTKEGAAYPALAAQAGAAAGNDPSAQRGEKPPLVIVVPFSKLEPQLTVRMLQAQGVDRKISEFTTAFLQNGAGRLHNIRSTAASIHDVLLKPGELFDYAAYIKETEAKFGFQEAPVIVNGKLVPGIGGGICQVSTTLYNAVLRAGLYIVERRNHSLPVSYVPLGQDATFASGYINFKFRNSTVNHLLIRTMADDRQLTVKLFGNIPADLSYSIESRTVETLPVPVKFVVNPTLPSGKQEQVSAGRPGYVVETYRYQRKNGVLIGQERISRDTYSAQPAVIARNQSGIPKGQEVPQPSKQPQTPIIEDGVKGPVYR